MTNRTNPRTPAKKSGEELSRIIESLNVKYDLQIPNDPIFSPSVREKQRESLENKCFNGLRWLYYNRSADVRSVIANFEEWAGPRLSQWVFKPRQEFGTLPTRYFLRTDGYKAIPEEERQKRLRYFEKLIRDEIYLLTQGSNGSLPLDRPRDLSNGPQRASDAADSELKVPDRPVLTKRKSIEEKEVFATAPSSPLICLANRSPSVKAQDEFDDSDFDELDFDAIGKTNSFVDGSQELDSRKTKKRQSTIVEFMAPSKLLADPAPKDDPTVSFSTTTTSGIFSSQGSRALGTSFNTDITDITVPMDDDPSQSSQMTGVTLSQEVKDLFDAAEAAKVENKSSSAAQCKQKLISDLLQNGPFASQESFSRSISLRHRYELERIARAWGIPFNMMLAGDSMTYDYERFWEWVATHSQRRSMPLPEKSAPRAWAAAVERFKDTAKHSEVVVLTGELDWCEKSEPGILKLRLNPLKIERTCRFHRRFGSDRFLSLTIPAPTRPPPHLRSTSPPSLLRESIVKWLTQNVHHCLGRKWRPFYVEDVDTKKKRNGDIRFRVVFFAIDGIDFDHSNPRPPVVAPVNQSCDQHTPMSLEALLEWHIARDANIEQSDCKLFQRIGLGLSKTWATVVLRPEEILHLKDIPGKQVMNDGCALMSRALAREICDHLGISGNTPSCFQGRIAGAKGLWMVDKHNSSISAGDRGFWIQISDSQLKIKPHPCYWDPSSVDDEQLTFEVANWAKPLHPVDLNVQLLTILEHGGRVREYVAELMRRGIEQMYQDFAEVIEQDSIILGRNLIQKIRPLAEDGLSRNKFRRLDQWILDDAECIIRLLEAGFSPRNFSPLRDRLRHCLKATLDRYVEDLHIRVPLSTYAYCIADPYGVLNEDEVHLGFSTQWQDPAFEDNLLDGVDVLVARLPAHLPSDIQRRRAVWKPELRHFKDVIVFPTKGDKPLAQMLSGGDYDGDMPWICWDQGIVKSFKNTPPPDPENTPPEYFGLQKHSTPMKEIHSTDEFIEKTFMFNLTLSNLGRCTLEHEKIIYEEEGSVNCEKAKELACLLSYLVDGRKAGVQLSEEAWQKYRKKISPRMRLPPAYKDPGRRKWKPSNIIDYLRFEVAEKQKNDLLKKFEDLCDELDAYRGKDEDLVRPWRKAMERANREKAAGGPGHLFLALKEVERRVEESYSDWQRVSHGEKKAFAVTSQAAADLVHAIRPPAFEHPLVHTWNNSEYEWTRLLASCVYNKYATGNFAFYAVGETLCRIKTGNAPARLVRDMVYSCYKVSSKVSRRLAAKEVDEDSDSEYEGPDAIEALAALDYDDDDGASVE
ncbi:putative RNA-directed RNA polymerase [Thermoascus aurantiacus ATCC 26904]